MYMPWATLKKGALKPNYYYLFLLFECCCCFWPGLSLLLPRSQRYSVQLETDVMAQFKAQMLWDNIEKGDLTAVHGLLEHSNINLEERDDVSWRVDVVIMQTEHSWLNGRRYCIVQSKNLLQWQCLVPSQSNLKINEAQSIHPGSTNKLALERCHRNTATET